MRCVSIWCPYMDTWSGLKSIFTLPGAQIISLWPHWSQFSLFFSALLFVFQVRGLYKGMLSPLVSSAAINAIVFGTSNNINRFLSKQSPFRQRKDLPLYCHYLSGSAAGALQCAVSGPSELIKTRLQVDGQGARGLKNALYRSPFHCAQVVYAQQGLRGLFRGTLATGFRDSPGFGFYFLTYEGLCRALSRKGQATPVWVLLTAGGFAGISAWLFTYPFDVVKSRLQAQSMKPGRRKYDGIVDCFRKSYREGGRRVFTRGLSTTLIRAFPVNAVTFYAVEVFFTLFNIPSKISLPPCPDPVPAPTPTQ